MRKMLAIAACGFALAACSSSGEMMKTATPTVPLQFESEPAGAEVKTSGGQTCRTPCALAVPAADFMATYSLNGFQPQNVAVKLMPPDDPRGDSELGFASSQPRFDPSPVYAELVKAPPKRAAPKKPRVARPAAEPQPSASAPRSSAPPPMQPTAPAPSSSPWPPAANPVR